MTGKYQAYPKYKDSSVEWVGELPNHWTLKRLGHLGCFTASGIDKKIVNNEPLVKIINYTDVYGNTNNVLVSDREYMVVSCPQSKKIEHQIGKGDLLFTPSSETIDDIGVSCLVNEDMQDTSFSYHLIRLKFTEELFYNFRKYLTNNVFVLNQFSKCARGTTRQTLGRDDFKSATVVLPPFEEQEKIANFLDHEVAKIDTLIDKQQQLIKLLKEKRQAVIRHAVTKGLNPDAPMKDSGVEWLGNVPERWKVKRIKFVCKLESGHTPSKTESSYWVPEECIYDWVSLNDTKTLDSSDFISETSKKISSKGIENSSAHLLPAGIVVFNRDGARVGLAAITTKEMAVSQHIIAWVCNDEIVNEFLLYVIYAMKSEIYRLTVGSTIPTIGMGDVKQMTSTVPPFKEQNKIVNVLRAKLKAIDETMNLLGEQFFLLKERRTALISAAVTGKIDVRNWKAPKQVNNKRESAR
jgi:type I restriction enzyme, S subunit